MKIRHDLKEIVEYREATRKQKEIKPTKPNPGAVEFFKNYNPGFLTPEEVYDRKDTPRKHYNTKRPQK